jgi:hypothetical protein
MMWREITEDVWHATPHRFDQFSTEFLGSGEGFNSYGWGLYFASRREVADYYRSKFSRDTGSGHVLRVSLPDDATRYLLWDTRLRQQSLLIRNTALSFLSMRETPPEEYSWGTGCSIQTNLKRSNAEIESHRDGGFMVYADDGGWTFRRSFETLPEALKAAKRKIKEDLLRLTGEKFYDSLKWEFGGAKQASLALLDKGIYGIKYLDSGSRRAKEGSYNYVIFDAAQTAIKDTQ